MSFDIKFGGLVCFSIQGGMECFKLLGISGCFSGPMVMGVSGALVLFNVNLHEYKC